MKRNSRTLLSTTVAVVLNLNVQISHDGRSHLYIWPLLPLNWVLMASWKAKQFGRYLGEGLADIFKITILCLTLCNIGLKSILYGLGAEQ